MKIAELPNKIKIVFPDVEKDQLFILAHQLKASIQPIQKRKKIPTYIEAASEIVKDSLASPEQFTLSVFNKKAKETCRKIIGTKKVTALGIINYVTERLNKLDVKKIECLEILSHCCFCFSSLTFPEIDIEMNRGEKFLYEDLKPQLMRISNGALGYWTKEQEIRKQKRDNLEITTIRKEERKTELRGWIETKKKPKEYRIEAQQKWGVSERTVLKYEQEIRDEKTAILRKNNDIS